MRLILLLVLFCLCLDASSQVLNIESKRFHADTLGWVGTGMFRFNAVKNVSRVTQFGSNLHLQYRNKRTRYLVLSEVNVLNSGNSSPINTGYGHLRAGRKVGNLWNWESFAQAQFNKPLKMDLRFMVGSGLRFKVLDSKKIRLYFATLPVLEYEEIKADHVINRTPRISSYVSFHWDMADNVEIENTTYYQPSVLLVKDFRMAGESSIRIKIKSWCGWACSFQYLLDSRQPVGIPNWTYRLENRLEITF